MRVTYDETFEIENQASELFGGTEFPVEVPVSGSFQIQVEIRGGLSCFDCCGDISIYDVDNNPTNDAACPNDEGGSPRWTGVSTEINKQEGIPEEYTLSNVYLRNCNFCGC